MNSGKTASAKDALRGACRHARNTLPGHLRLKLDQQINDSLLDCEPLASAGYIAAFSAFDGEPDIGPALTVMFGRGQHICLPVIDHATRSMHMHDWTPGSNMNAGDLGIMQPGDSEIVAPSALDIVLVPLVAWDKAGNRIGMGAGYYDRYLEPYRDASRPLRLGVAYAVQEVDVIQADDHDVGLHALVSENGWKSFERN